MPVRNLDQFTFQAIKGGGLRSGGDSRGGVIHRVQRRVRYDDPTRVADADLTAGDGVPALCGAQPSIAWSITGISPGKYGQRVCKKCERLALDVTNFEGVPT